MELKKIRIRCQATGVFTDVYLKIDHDKIDFIGCSAYPAGNDACIRCKSSSIVAYMNPNAAKRTGTME